MSSIATAVMLVISGSNLNQSSSEESVCLGSLAVAGEDAGIAIFGFVEEDITEDTVA